VRRAHDAAVTKPARLGICVAVKRPDGCERDAAERDDFDPDGHDRGLSCAAYRAD
jgi:hypothetical protein